MNITAEGWEELQEGVSAAFEDIFGALWMHEVPSGTSQRMPVGEDDTIHDPQIVGQDDRLRRLDDTPPQKQVDRSRLLQQDVGERGVGERVVRGVERTAGDSPCVIATAPCGQPVDSNSRCILHGAIRHADGDGSVRAYRCR